MKKRSLLILLLSFILVFSLSASIISADTPIEYTMGDANLDGNVNTRDVVLIKQSIVGITELTDKQKLFADTYKDGVINTRDVVLIQQSIVGMEVDLGTHEHIFDKQVEDELYFAYDATCTSGKTYYYSCLCGVQGEDTFEVGEELGHNFGAPTYVWDNDKSTATRVCTPSSKPAARPMTLSFPRTI